MKKKVLSAILAGAAGISLLCGFASVPEENSAELIAKHFETTEPVVSVHVEDSVSRLTIRTADTDRVTVDYSDLAGQPLYTISVEDGLLTVKANDLPEGNTPEAWSDFYSAQSTSDQPDRDLIITLPDKQYQEVNAALTVGTLSVQGIYADKLSSASMVADIDMGGVQAGQLLAQSVVGRLSIHDTQAQTATFNAVTGATLVRNFTVGKLSASSVVGGIKLQQVTADEILVQATVGNLTLDQVKTDAFSQVSLLGFTQGAVNQ